MLELDLRGKTAVVTGAGGSIGGGIARSFAQCGANVALLDYNLEAAAGRAAEITKQWEVFCKAYQADVSAEAAVKEVFAAVRGDFGSIDILCTAAGIVGDSDDYLRTPAADMELTLKINLLGTSYCLRAALEYMMPQKSGKIITISSIAGRMGVGDQANYASSKAGIISLTQSVAQFAAKSNINVNCICPGYLKTAMWEEGLQFYAAELNVSPEEAWQMVALDRIALGRAQEPEDIGNMAAFLASELAKNITGQAINVCGGSLFN
ncbi:MAG: SDR family oxidoreductase [Bacillota bacterium]|nr:SDR family oxidoreductase [Bacillota bacterium]